MTDKFQGYTEGLNSPPSNILTLTPNDGTDLPAVIRCINAATSGSVRVTTINGDTGTVYIAAGVTFPIRANRVWATGTTASGLVGLY